MVWWLACLIMNKQAQVWFLSSWCAAHPDIHSLSNGKLWNLDVTLALCPGLAGSYPPQARGLMCRAKYSSSVCSQLYFYFFSNSDSNRTSYEGITTLQHSKDGQALCNSCPLKQLKYGMNWCSCHYFVIDCPNKGICTVHTFYQNKSLANFSKTVPIC